jgi:hypothetical protein
LPQKDSLGVLIDCQNTSFNFRRWNYALYYVLLRSFEEADIEFSLNEAQFTEADAKRYTVQYNLFTNIAKFVIVLGGY